MGLVFGRSCQASSQMEGLEFISIESGRGRTGGSSLPWSSGFRLETKVCGELLITSCRDTLPG